VLDQDRVEARAVALTERALGETALAFDGVAAGYDQSNRENPLLSEMRRQVRAAVRTAVPAGSSLLDLGCGPGTDLDAFVDAGYRVTALDSSRGMVEAARAHVRRGALERSVDVRSLGIHQLDRLAPVQWDAACANFGPLNCVASLSEAARLIGARLRPGGVLVASVIGRVCPWEVALYLARGDRARALLRFERGFVPVPLGGRTVWTRYYTPGEFEPPFGDAGFRRESLRALALFAPPPYLQAFATRHPQLTAFLQRLDAVAGGWPGCRLWGDHFLIVLRKW
jgi:SAM-dependent methyltransferase